MYVEVPGGVGINVYAGGLWLLKGTSWLTLAPIQHWLCQRTEGAHLGPLPKPLLKAGHLRYQALHGPRHLRSGVTMSTMNSIYLLDHSAHRIIPAR